MADDRATDPAGRRNLLVRAIVEHRRSGAGRRADDATVDGSSTDEAGTDGEADEDGIGDEQDEDVTDEEPDDAGAGEELVLEGAGRSVAYADRSLRLAVDDAERERLEALCGEYRVFKLQQPATRKAPEGVVFLSAVTDAKHLADFLEDMFRDVYGADADYELRVG